MTKRDKVVIFSASLLALCIIASFIALYVRTGRTGGVDTATFIMACSAMLAGISSVLFVYLAKVRRRGYEKLLDNGYYRKYEIIRDAVTSSQLSAGMKREIKDDVLDLLLSAQKSGKTAEGVVSDPVAFSKEIVRSYLKPGFFAVLSLFDAAIAFIAFVVGTNILLWLEQPASSFFTLGVGVNMAAFYAFTALLVIPATKWFVRSGRNLAYMIPISFGILFIVLSETLRRYFPGTGWSGAFLDGTLVMIPNAAVFIAYLVMMPLLAAVKAWLRKILLAAG